MEQAHSSLARLGRDAAPFGPELMAEGLRRPRTPIDVAPRDPRTAPKAFGAVPARARTSAIWLSLVCLDAPLVSVAWLWLFARTFHVSVAPPAFAALFLTAWLIYLADRIVDSRALPDGVLRSLRHDFCLRHQRSWAGAFVVIALIDTVMIASGLGGEIAIAGVVVGALAVIHLVVNHLLGGAWPPLPLKEVAVGTLFAAGTLVALVPVARPITATLVAAVSAFAGVCTLNCISIAFWEKELDEAQGKVSFATHFPSVDRHLGKLSIAMALASGVIAIICREAAPILASLSVSSVLLAWLNFNRDDISRDQRTALADLVLLTPLVALLVMKA